MVTKNILVDTALIGTIHFYAYIFNNSKGDIGFGLFINDGPKPIVYFLNDKSHRITLHFDDPLIVWLCEQSQFTTDQRRALFQEFLNFVIQLEKKATRMIFRELKMTFLSDSREIIKYKRMYIHYKSSSNTSVNKQMLNN